MKQENTIVTNKELRNFGLIIGGITAVLFGIIFPLLHGRDTRSWPWIVGTVLIAWGLAHPASLRPLYRVWMAIGNVLGWLNTRIILGILFFIVILPIGLLMRLVGRDPMVRRFDPDTRSYRVSSTKRKSNHVERPF